AARFERAAAVPATQRARPSRQPHAERMLGADRVRQLARDTLLHEGVHAARRVEPTMRIAGKQHTRLAHELAEMRLDARGLPQAHEVSDHGHVASLDENRSSTSRRARTWATWVQMARKHKLDSYTRPCGTPAVKCA